MDIIIYLCVGPLLFLGLIGCFLPVIPGPPLAFGGYLLLLLTPCGDSITLTMIGILALLTIATVVVDYVIPALGVKLFGGTAWGKWGCVIGSIIGIFFMPWGLIAGPFLGAFIGELLGESNASDAFRSGIGSLIGFIFGTVFKVAVTIFIIYRTWVAIF